MGDRIVNVPPGCLGVEIPGVRKPYLADRPGGHAMIPEHHAARIDGVDTGGILSGGFRVTVRTKAGRKCPSCGSRWYAWTTECRKCHVATEPE